MGLSWIQGSGFGTEEYRPREPENTANLRSEFFARMICFRNAAQSRERDPRIQIKLVLLSGQFPYRNCRLQLGKRLGLLAVLQNLLCIIIAHSRLVVKHFKVGVFEQLGMALAQELPNGLLYAGIIDLSLAGGLAG